eukprot:gene14037-19974_t
MSQLVPNFPTGPTFPNWIQISQGYCHKHGDTYNVGWRSLGAAGCKCCPPDSSFETAEAPPTPLVLSGPLWTGPLHSREDLLLMQQEAQAKGWCGYGFQVSSPHHSIPTAGTGEAGLGKGKKGTGGEQVVAGSSGDGSSLPSNTSLAETKIASPHHSVPAAGTGEADLGKGKRGIQGEQVAAMSSGDGSSSPSNTSLAGAKMAGPPSAIPCAVSQPGERGTRVIVEGESERRGVEAGSSSATVLVRSKKNMPKKLEGLLATLLEEAEPQLPPGFLTLASVAKHLSQHPSRDKLINELQARGFSACLSHIETRALRTNARMYQRINELQAHGFSASFSHIEARALRTNARMYQPHRISELMARGISACLSHIETRAFRTNARVYQVLEAASKGLGIPLRADSDFFLQAQSTSSSDIRSVSCQGSTTHEGDREGSGMHTSQEGGSLGGIQSPPDDSGNLNGVRSISQESDSEDGGQGTSDESDCVDGVQGLPDGALVHRGVKGFARDGPEGVAAAERAYMVYAD